MAQLDFDLHSDISTSTAAPDFSPAHHCVGVALGWDHAHHGITPPAQHLFAGSPVRLGWQAALAIFGRRTLRNDHHTRQWLQLRTEAWLRGHAFELHQVTPNHLRQIDTTHCPVTRQALNQKQSEGTQAVVTRLRQDAGFAAGHLAVVSQQAHQAQGTRNFAELQAMAQSLAQGPIEEAGGMNAAEWSRLSILASFVTPMAHEDAAALPLLVLPPNRLQLFNPIQALQAMLTRQIATPGWGLRLARLECLLPSTDAKRHLHTFALALMARWIEAGSPTQAERRRWALEDAWTTRPVQRCWQRLAQALTADDATRVVESASRLGLMPGQQAVHRSETVATEGWAIGTGGFQPPGIAITQRQHAAEKHAGVRRSAGNVAPRSALPFDAQQQPALV